MRLSGRGSQCQIALVQAVDLGIALEPAGAAHDDEHRVAPLQRSERAHCHVGPLERLDAADEQEDRVLAQAERTLSAILRQTPSSIIVVEPVRDEHVGERVRLLDAEEDRVRDGARWACAKGHSFDVARSGYLSLLQPQDQIVLVVVSLNPVVITMLSVKVLVHRRAEVPREWVDEAAGRNCTVSIVTPTRAADSPTKNFSTPPLLTVNSISFDPLSTADISPALENRLTYSWASVGVDELVRSISRP